MAAPTRLTTDYGTATGNRTMSGAAINVSAGDVCVAIISMDATATVTPNAASVTAGWTKVGQWSDATNAVTQIMFELAVTATGTMPDLTTLGMTARNYAVLHQVFAVAGSHLVRAGPTTATGSSTNPNPPALANPAGSAKDIRFFATMSGDAIALPTAGPSGWFTLLLSASSGTASTGCVIGVSHLSFDAVGAGASTDPGVFTRATEQWVASTVGYYFVDDTIPLVLDDATSTSQADAPALSPKTALSPAATASLTQASAPTLSPKTALTVANDNSGSSAGNVVVSSPAGLTLNSGVSASQASSAVITPRWVLVVAAAQSYAVPMGVNSTPEVLVLDDFSNPAIWGTTGNQIAVSGGTATFTAANSGHQLYRLWPMILKNTQYRMRADVVITGVGSATFRAGGLTAPSQNATGAYDSGYVSQSLDGFGVGITGAGTGTVDNFELSWLGGLALAPKTALTVAAAASLSTSTSPLLSVGLGVSPALSLSALGPVTIAPKTALTVAGSTSPSNASNAVIAPVLGVASPSSASQASSPVLYAHPIIFGSPAVSLSQASSPTLLPKTALAVQPAVSLGGAANVNVAPLAPLTPAAAVSLSQASQPAVGPSWALSLDPARSIVTVGPGGPELMINGDGTDTTGWTLDIFGSGNCDLSSVGGVFRLMSTDGWWATAGRQVAITPGKVYRARARHILGNRASGIVTVGSTGYSSADYLTSGFVPGSYDTQFLATSSIAWVMIQAGYPEVNGYVDFDDISLTEQSLPLTLSAKAALLVGTTRSLSQSTTMGLAPKTVLAPTSSRSLSQVSALSVVARWHLTLGSLNSPALVGGLGLTWNPAGPAASVRTMDLDGGLSGLRQLSVDDALLPARRLDVLEGPISGRVASNDDSLAEGRALDLGVGGLASGREQDIA